MTKLALKKDLLVHLYEDRGYSDNEIANFLGFTRAYISRQRRNFGIPSRNNSIRLKGLNYVKKKLIGLGFKVEDIKNDDLTRQFDLLLNGEIRISVRTSKCHIGYSNESFTFPLTESESKGNESDNKTKLSNGRLRKVLSSVCDYAIFVGVKGNSALPIIIPSKYLDGRMQTLHIPASGQGKYAKFVKAWDLIK